MTQRQKNVALLAAVLAIVIGAALWLRRSSGQSSLPAPKGALAAVPRDAYFLATIDVEALRASPLAKLLSPGTDVVGNLARLCGFDPLSRIKELAIAIPEGGESGDFGVVARGDIGRDELVACADKVMASRGGTSRVSQRGAFVVVDDASESQAGAPRAYPAIALRDHDLVIIGRGAWLGAMLDAAEGKQPSVLDNKTHAELRAPLASRAIVATAILPRPLRERLKREMAGEGTPDENVAMAGVLGVESAALALGLGKDVELASEMRCESESACDEVKKLLERKRFAFSRDLTARLLGLGPLVDSLTIEAKNKTLSLSARAPADDIARALERLLQFRGKPANTPPHTTDTTGPARSTRPPDAVVKPTQDAGHRLSADRDL